MIKYIPDSIQSEILLALKKLKEKIPSSENEEDLENIIKKFSSTNGINQDYIRSFVEIFTGSGFFPKTLFNLVNEFQQLYYENKDLKSDLADCVVEKLKYKEQLDLQLSHSEAMFSNVVKLSLCMDTNKAKELFKNDDTKV